MSERTIEPRMLVTRRIAAGIGTNRERWAGWVESVTEQTDRSGYVNRTAWVVDREWVDVSGTWHPLPDAAVHVGNLVRHFDPATGLPR